MNINASTPVGRLAFEICKQRLALQVLRSNAGYYIGTMNDEGPFSRESAEYWRIEADARHVLATGEWTQRDEP